MALLPTYKNFYEKEPLFKPGFFKIDTKEKFDEWYGVIKKTTSFKKTMGIYRGMKEAKYKLYTSTQRLWIQNDMKEWGSKTYLEFISDMVQSAKKKNLLKKVFDIYDYSDSEREFPILSILQHYGAPTPLMDWSYDMNVALFFATEDIITGNGTGDIDNYFSIYFIPKPAYKNQFVNLLEILKDGESYPSISTFSNWGDDDNQNKNAICYLSDFEKSNEDFDYIKIQNKEKPLTLVYNQNIIAQEGLFIFNPFSEKSIEDIFNLPRGSIGANISLESFDCFNIKKDLADYIRRKINVVHNVNDALIYPELYNDADQITHEVLNNYAKV